MTHLLLLADDAPKPTGSDTQLIIAAIVGIAAIVVMITWFKLHPFVSLTIGAIGVGIGAGEGVNDAVTSFSTGAGATFASVGLLIGLGAMFGKLLADSGGADQIVDTIIGKSSRGALPWAMALVGAIVGLPMFFEIGLVLLMPVIVLVTRRSGLPLMLIAIPTLAGLSVMHGLVPPHPGPLVAVAAFHANLGLTLALGVAVAIPTVIIAGPLFARLAARWVDVPVPELFRTAYDEEDDAADGGSASGGTATLTKTAPPETRTKLRPSFAASVTAILVPVVLMLARAVADIVAEDSTSHVKTFLDFIGTPLVALTIAVLAGIALLGRPARMNRSAIETSLTSSLAPIAGVTFIVGAGGGFKQVLIDTGIAQVIANWIEGSSISVLLLGWFVAVLIRVATGSATVAIITASGIMAPVVADLSTSHVSLMVLAVGSGSLFLSHVNDAGFWLVKEYLGTSIGQTLKTWTVMECIISVCGLGGVLVL
ncbi:MAG TPA: gluconate:H+ symporter, partial [Jatrophihabitans sp.]|nr:gluconate:H+ symporter [Jatrophihabitans sp.]